MGGNGSETDVNPTPVSVADPLQVRLEPMRKPKKLWKVGDLARHVQLTRQAIHHYVLLGLIQEVERTPSGHRLFDDEAFKRLQRIERLKNKGMRLTDIAALLNQPPRRRREGSEGDEQHRGDHGAHEQE